MRTATIPLQPSPPAGRVARVFGPPELEIVEQAYKLACDRLAQNPFCDAAKDREREKAIRESLFFLACRGDDAESLCERVFERFRSLGWPVL